VVYLTTLSVTQGVYHRTTVWLMNNELERILKEAIVA
jgi:hypothetical protein